MNRSGLRFILLGIALTLFSVGGAHAKGRTFLGIDVLVDHNFKEIEGARVALITNHTGLDRHLHRTIDLFYRSKKVTLVCIMTPEHGLLGTQPHGEKVGTTIDTKTGLPVYSLYGETTRPTEQMLQGVDTIVYDIQDVGTRFYTYIATMGQALEEASKRQIRMVVLDRPNPIRGDIIEGDILDPDIKRMTGYFPIPVRYSLTIGELAGWMNDSEALGAHLDIIEMKNWRRSDWFDDTGLPFVAPSPNIQNAMAALLYSGMGAFEATNVSVGRGTERPFEIIGAPWLNAPALCAYLREQNFAGVLIETENFTPTDDLYKDTLCHGVRLVVTNRNTIRPFKIFLAAFNYLARNETAFKPEWEEVRVVTGSAKLKDAVARSLTMEEIFSQYELSERDFQQAISTYLLY